MKENNYLTPEETMALLQVSRTTLYKLRKRGLRCVKVPRTRFLRFRRQDIDEFLASHSTPPP